ncbi:MAG: hypothetical protein AB7P52_19045 [Alphaproteobacteria bacterium]
MRFVALALLAVVMIAAPVGSASHASAPESSHHAAAAALDHEPGSPCNAQHGNAGGETGGALGADCCLNFCHVVSGPVAGAPRDAVPADFSIPVRLGFADARAPGGLLPEPPLDPPRSDA